MYMYICICVCVYIYTLPTRHPALLEVFHGLLVQSYTKVWARDARLASLLLNVHKLHK